MRELVGRLIKTAKWYKVHMVGNTFVFSFSTDDSVDKTIKLVFKPYHFLNLTGIKYIDSSGNAKEHSAREFYHRCIHKPYITEREIAVSSEKENKQLSYRLQTLQYLEKINKILQIDEYSSSEQPEYMVGNSRCSLRIAYDDKTDSYYPVSFLNQNVMKTKLHFKKCKLISRNYMVYKKT